MENTSRLGRDTSGPSLEMPLGTCLQEPYHALPYGLSLSGLPVPSLGPAFSSTPAQASRARVTLSSLRSLVPLLNKENRAWVQELETKSKSREHSAGSTQLVFLVMCIALSQRLRGQQPPRFGVLKLGW